jgi:hypothetical protein
VLIFTYKEKPLYKITDAKFKAEALIYKGSANNIAHYTDNIFPSVIF